MEVKVLGAGTDQQGCSVEMELVVPQLTFSTPMTVRDLVFSSWSSYFKNDVRFVKTDCRVQWEDGQ